MAQSCGYELDEEVSRRACKVMKRGVDKVVVATAMKDGHGIHFSHSDDSDRGCVIEFAQKRLGGGLVLVQMELRGWLRFPDVSSPQRRSPEKRPK